jgi:hypothetical protein
MPAETKTRVARVRAEAVTGWEKGETTMRFRNVDRKLLDKGSSRSAEKMQRVDSTQWQSGRDQEDVGALRLGRLQAALREKRVVEPER